MCGIVGIYNFNQSPVDQRELKKFKHSLAHRGPDAEGIYINKSQNLGFGHTRLRIIDLNNNADQPMVYKENFVINYNGEIYNYLEIKSELESLGHKFKTKCDTEIILASYVEWGEKCQKKLNGMWAFAIWDERLKKLFLSRDRFGVKPLYYFFKKNKFFFASELKAFMFINKENIPDFDYNHLVYSANTYFHKSNSIMQNTFLKNVKELNPGYQMNLDANGKLEVKKWWSTIENLIDVPKRYEEQVEKFKHLFFSACKLRLISDAKISTSLSGGIDSSAIVSSIKNLNLDKKEYQSPHNAFVLNYKGDYDTALYGNDLEYSKLVSKNENIKSKIIDLELDKISPDEIIKIIYHQEEISGSDGIGPWYIYKNMKKNGIKVSIDGHGSDEVLAGYPKYTKYAMDECKSIFDLKRYLDLMTIKLQIDNSLDLKKIVKKIINKFVIKKKNLIEDNYFKIKPEEPTRLKTEDISSLSSLNRILYDDFHYNINPYNLKRYDKFSMAHSVESRNPFLDWRIVTYLFSLPSKSKIGNGFTKRILRDSMKGLVHDKILKRVLKKGFNPTNKLSNFKMFNFINDSINSKSFVESNIWDGKKINHDFANKRFTYQKIFKILQVHYLIKKID